MVKTANRNFETHFQEAEMHLFLPPLLPPQKKNHNNRWITFYSMNIFRHLIVKIKWQSKLGKNVREEEQS